MFREAELQKHFCVESLHVALLRRRFGVENQETAHHDSIVEGASENLRLAPTALLHVSIDQMRMKQSKLMQLLIFSLDWHVGVNFLGRRSCEA